MNANRAKEVLKDIAESNATFLMSKSKRRLEIGDALSFAIKAVEDRDKWKNNTLEFITGDCKIKHLPTLEDIEKLGCPICAKAENAKLREERSQVSAALVEAHKDIAKKDEDYQRAVRIIEIGERNIVLRDEEIALLKEDMADMLSTRDYAIKEYKAEILALKKINDRLHTQLDKKDEEIEPDCDAVDDIHMQADIFGMESLTEDEQIIVKERHEEKDDASK